MLRSPFACALVALLVCVSVPVLAAGPDPAGSAQTPVPVSHGLTWVGFHAGGLGGFAFEPVTRTSTNTVSNVITDSSFSGNGALGGGRGGYIFRTRTGLVGFEGDDMAGSISGQFNSTNASGATTSTSVSKTKMLGTARGIYAYSFGKALLTIGAGVAWHSVTTTRTQVLGQVNNAPVGTVEILPVSNAGLALSADVSKQLAAHLTFSVGYLYAHFSHTSLTPLSLISSVTSTPVHAIVAGVTYFAK